MFIQWLAILVVSVCGRAGVLAGEPCVTSDARAGECVAPDRCADNVPGYYGAAVNDTRYRLSRCPGKQLCCVVASPATADTGCPTGAEDRSLHRCGDGSFVRRCRLCDGVADCPDGSDEAGEAGECVAADCPPQYYRCRGGWCVRDRLVCDGVSVECGGDCPDGSDEAGEAGECVAADCPPQYYRCRGGWCVRDRLVCDGVSVECGGDCPDGSDEAGEAGECVAADCPPQYYRCRGGWCVRDRLVCDGNKDCPDGSDEAEEMCRSDNELVPGQQFEPVSFSSLYSLLLNRSSTERTEVADEAKCDPTTDRLDQGPHRLEKRDTSESCVLPPFPAHGTYTVTGLSTARPGEALSQAYISVTCEPEHDLTGEGHPFCYRGRWLGEMPSCIPKVPTTCILPRPPTNGKYTVAGQPGSRPGQSLDVAYLTFACDPGFGLVGNASIYCFAGTWLEKFPLCSRYCKLNPHPSVEYRCLVPGYTGGYRECGQYEPSQTQVAPKCRAPNYYYYSVLPSMKCIDGYWNYIATCLPECGKVSPTSVQLVTGGHQAVVGELPWHVGIYRKDSTPYKQQCGGTIMSTTIVVSAAHCFWTDADKLLPASRFAVAAGKLYRAWDSDGDVATQKSDVTDIKVPNRYQGRDQNFQEDIALVFLATALVYKTHIRPVCLDFDRLFNAKQLSSRNLGKVAGWGLTSADGDPSPALKVVELPYVEVEECLTDASFGFKELITSDKICAGYKNGTALCKGDSGGGLSFPELERGTVRYYLRGIVSTAPRVDTACNTLDRITFTEVVKHEHFIKQFYEWENT